MASPPQTTLISPRSKPNRLKLLPHRLVLAALQQDQISSCTYALLKLLLFPTSQDGFFSFTDTSDGISLVIEDQFLPLFPSEALQCTTQRWRAIKFDEGPLGFESTGIVSSVATPLAKAKISLYYVSTYTTGYTLVEEDSLEDAVECLKTSGFSFSNDSNMPKQTTLRAGSRKTHPISPSTTTKTQMVIAQLPYKVNMAILPKHSTESHAKALIQLFFYPETGKRFFSFTETPDEISLMMDAQAVEMFPQDSLTLNSRIWRVLQICEGSYGSHGSETISKFAKPSTPSHVHKEPASISIMMAHNSPTSPQLQRIN